MKVRLPIFFLIAVLGCSSMPKVERRSVAETIDLSGEWNDIDSQMVAESMIKDALSHPWHQKFTDRKKTEPRVIVGTVANKSHEHINTETFVKDLEKELTNSGKVIFVAGRDQRMEVREERMDQAQHSRMDTAKSMGQETGADYMVKGQINTIFDGAGKQQVKYYQTELELIDMASNEKVWIGQKKIKKHVTYKKKKF